MPGRMTAAAILAVLIMAPAAARAADRSCPSARQIGLSPAVTVDVKIPNVAYRFDLDTRALTKLHRRPESNGSGHGTVLGLTTSRYSTNWRYQIREISKGNIHCYYLGSVNYTINLQELNVYVASEYKRGSCQYQTVMQHESEHVRLNKSVIQKFAPILKEHARAMIDQQFPIRGTAEASPDRTIKQMLQQASNTVLQRMSAERDRSNGVIDTGYSYAVTAKRCKQW